MEFRCNRCGSKNLYIEDKSNHTGLYCCDCGKWIKWLSSEEIRVFNNQNKTTNSDSFGLVLTDMECELLNILLDNELNVMKIHYGNTKSKRFEELCSLRDKIVKYRGHPVSDG